MTRVRLRIDQIVADRPGLDRRALEAALRHELGQSLAGDGTAALGQGGSRHQVRTRLPKGKGADAASVATTVVRAVKP